MKRYFVLATLGLFFATTILVRVFATSDINFSVESTYKIDGNGSGTVGHVINGKNTTSEKTPTILKIPFAGSEVSSILAKVNDKIVPATISENKTTIDVGLPDLTGKDKNWKLTLDYKSKMISELGKAKLALVPSMNDIGIAITSQKTVVSADLEAGLALALPSPDRTDIATGKQIFTYQNPNGAVKDMVTLTFGDETPAFVTVETELKNGGWWWGTQELTLPPDTNQQQIILESLDPKPTNVRLDQDGNILAQYKLGPKKSIKVSARAIVNVRNLSYDLTSEKKVDEIDSTLKELYTVQTEKWFGGQVEVDVNPVASAVETATAIYDAVVKQARTENAVGSNTDYAGVEIDSTGKYADILIGELRENGIPARAVLGKLATDGQFILGNGQNHIWVESYLPDTGWVTMDPSLAVAGDYYGSSEVMHIGLALWGVSDDSPPINLDIMNVEYTNTDFVIPETQPVLTAVKTVIFPGISVMNVTVDMPAGVITDGNAVAFGSQTYLLGSLAPLQTAGAKDFRFGAGAFNTEEALYGYAEDGVIVTELSSAQSATSYVVLIIEAALLVFAATLFFFIRKKRTAKKYKPSKDAIVMHDEDAGDSVEEIDIVGQRSIDDGKTSSLSQKASQKVESPTPSKPSVTRGTIDSSSKGASFQKGSTKNPRRHIIQ